MKTVTIPVKQGRLLLDQELLKEAGIEGSSEVAVEKGRIVILPLLSKEAKEALLRFGKDAPEGRWDRASEQHDEYLYRRKQ